MVKVKLYLKECDFKKITHNQICSKVQRANTPLSLIELSKIIIKRANDNRKTLSYNILDRINYIAYLII